MYATFYMDQTITQQKQKHDTACSIIISQIDNFERSPVMKARENNVDGCLEELISTQE